ncbi:MAG: SUF system NifU family Fe-S cluster assembly protein [Atopobiaceae bacterium]|nr:SUF system NifU family Fe-S cluster assembly protein [Atopobiaceae bacterium]
MDVTSLYNEQFMDHVTHPDYKYAMEDATHEHDGINPSCGDELHLSVRLGDDGRIEECAYTGHGCAVSMASADMMSDLMVGKTPAEAIELCALFKDMVTGAEKDADKLEQELDEAALLMDVSHMPARVKCAELAWRTLSEMLQE